MKSRKVYPSDVSDAEGEFVAPYLTLMKEDAPQRRCALRDLFDALRWMVKAGGPWRLLPGDFPPWMALERQAKRWRRAGCEGYKRPKGSQAHIAVDTLGHSLGAGSDACQ